MNSKINKQDLITSIQLFLFLVPVGLIQNRIIMVVWYGMLAISIGIFLVEYFILRRQRKRESILVWMFLYLLVQACATFINGGNWQYGVLTLAVVCVFILYIEDCIRRNYYHFLEVFDWLLTIEMGLEIVAYIFNSHFLQQFACIYIYYSAWACVHMLSIQKSGKTDKKIYWISFILIALTVVKPLLNSDGSSNFEWTFYVMAILSCLFFLNRGITYKWNKIVNVKTFYLFILAFNLLVVVIQNYENIPGVKYLLENIMHKDITLTGRTSIWVMAMGRISQRPAWGYGAGYTKLVQSTDFWTNWLGIHGPHNQFLGITLSGGIITLVFYVLMIVKTTLPLLSCKNSVSVIISFNMIITFIELSVTYRNILNCLPLFVLFSIATNYKKECQKKIGEIIYVG